ncbi:MAG: hypothetical protein DRO94_00835 [Candidatus Altiarchaeales archaeon]|nr:MAG: hypothetical protein DRO95_01860 [Candidatus Altiarchaeales archaeon]RLI95290.1 MAG: hypothetical protein DRO94_00835 [Candidatus Altiarchaeales archaeon]HDO82464.1 DUF134 domain-containing protein [Candidatus Altiarchaeales archaeon]HEX55113.1 DUF134 domain-containing protein [Candidatus Altiarchaeales archaeon]
MRPKMCRRIWYCPEVRYFKPVGAGNFSDEINLTLDEFEAIRLKDYEGLDQRDAAERMDISQPTFHRLLESARKKIASALVCGKAIRIDGGVYIIMAERKPGRGRGRCGGFE